MAKIDFALMSTSEGGLNSMKAILPGFRQKESSLFSRYRSDVIGIDLVNNVRR